MSQIYKLNKNSLKKYESSINKVRRIIAGGIIQRREETPLNFFSRQTEHILLQIVVSGNITMLDNFILGDEKEYLELYANEIYSNDSLRQARYYLVMISTLLARHCTDSGLSEEIASVLNESFISYADASKNLEEIYTLIIACIREYTYTMRNYRYKECSPPIRKCLDYINSHIFQKISMHDLSDICNLSPNYLSDLFYKEIGLRPTEYIKQQRLSNSKIFLNDSMESITSISEKLCFASPSAFCAQFKKAYGMTPYAYRNSYK